MILLSLLIFFCIGHEITGRATVRENETEVMKDQLQLICAQKKSQNTQTHTRPKIQSNTFHLSGDQSWKKKGRKHFSKRDETALKQTP